MLFCNIDYLDENFEVKSNFFIGTKEDGIDYIAPTDPGRMYGERYDGTGKLLIPGLINAHSHAPMTLLRGYAEGLPLDRWLHEKVFPFEAKMNDASARPATDLAIAEMLRFGTVSFTDMYYFEEARIQAVLDAGIKANLSHGLISLGRESYYDMDACALNERLVRDWHGAGAGRLKIDFCVHAEYTNTEAVIRQIAEEAQSHGVNMHVHLSETLKEHEECKGRHGGLTPAAFFEDCGLFEVPTTAAHCVHLESGDSEILARHGVSVAACPASNMKLASGFADYSAMLEAGINLALGSDGVASNNNHDLFRDMYLLALVSKGLRLDPTLMSPAETLRCATLSGAVAQGRLDCGSIEPGKQADLVVLDMQGLHMNPRTDILNNLLYSAEGSDVCLTMVDGRVLYRDGEYPTIDVERAKFETQKAVTGILSMQ